MASKSHQNWHQDIHSDHQTQEHPSAQPTPLHLPLPERPLHCSGLSPLWNFHPRAPHHTRLVLRKLPRHWLPRPLRLHLRHAVCESHQSFLSTHSPVACPAMRGPCHPARDNKLEGEDQDTRALGGEDLALAPWSLKEKAQAVEVKAQR